MDYIISGYGAVADGVTNCREAIQNAIDECNRAGGGRVVIPAGRFLSGTLVLRSNVELHLESGAVLISSLNQEDLIDIKQEVQDFNTDIDWTGGCFLYACHEENISITGRGTIYGQGDLVFFDDGADGGIGECPKNIKIEKRPRTTFFEDIENLNVTDITFKDAAFWTLHMAGCRRVNVQGIRILNDCRGANNDGIDPDTCRDVVISNCFIETGDDAIVIKNSLPMAAKYGACENIIVSNCILNSHDSAIKIGTETGDAIRHVIISDCVFRDCSRGVGIWVRDGAVIEDIQVHHIIGNTLRYADCIGRDFAPGWWGKGEPIFISATSRTKDYSKMGSAPDMTVSGEKSPGIIRNISFDNIQMTAESCVFIAGEADSVIEDVRITNLVLTQQKQGTQEADCFDEQPSGRGVYAHSIPAVYARHVNSLSVSGTVRRKDDFKKNQMVQAEDTSDIRLSICEE